MKGCSCRPRRGRKNYVNLLNTIDKLASYATCLNLIKAQNNQFRHSNGKLIEINGKQRQVALHNARQLLVGSSLGK